MRDLNKKAELIRNMEKELHIGEEGRKPNMYIASLRATLQKYQTGKHQALMANMNSGKKLFNTIHERLAIETNRCLQETDISEERTNGK